ncbi:response regulator [Sediminibacterium sp.]|uniref:response regulator n=1 Tax=Sediminibacterium sp. TaxID=1917865 RepID=UPI00272EFC6B|nr:response regulator [Sediminibacterium sp.]MDP1971885.1 response regulator [Sediminibacterium sp.]MDP2419762.1 response regulator [Sediminibacterium sp.]
MANIAHPYTILIADDDEINRVILKHMLKYVNVDITCVADGEEAMAYLNEDLNRKVILLLDLNMPNMDGNEVIARVNMEPSFKSRIRIIVITANLLSAFLKIGMGDSVLDCLEKPVNKEELIELIKLGVTQLN